MRYPEFQQALLAEVKRQQTGEYSVELQTMEKNNGVRLAAICIRRAGEEIAPSIYLENYFEEYRRGVSCRHLARQVWEQYEEARVGRHLPEGFFSTYASVREQVFCRLVNYEKNREQLLTVPHEIWQDLAVTYYYQVDPRILTDGTILIRSEHLRRWGISEEELRRDAWENSLSKQPPHFQHLGDVLREMSGSAERADTSLSLLTNARRCLGAVCFCYPGETKKIGERIGGDYYILPSSIHECLILPDDGSYEKSQLDRMVREINRTQLEPQEVLSDRVYHYDLRAQAVC